MVVVGGDCVGEFGEVGEMVVYCLWEFVGVGFVVVVGVE